jgi:predicted nucleic acid-binding protein
MARQALVIDASVGVKWFSDKGEGSLQQALAIRDSHLAQLTSVIVPELFYFEVSNAIVHKKHIPTDEVHSAVAALFALGLQKETVDIELMKTSIELARRHDITVYDSCYAAIARKYDCPLVTANPRHQGQALGCKVIPIEQWRRDMD